MTPTPRHPRRGLPLAAGGIAALLSLSAPACAQPTPPARPASPAPPATVTRDEIERNRKAAEEALLQARAALEKQNEAGARALLQRAQPLAQYDPELGPAISMLLGDLELKANNPVAAAQAYEEVTRWIEDPRAAEAYEKAGAAYLKAGRLSDAAGALTAGAERYWRRPSAPAMRLEAARHWMALLEPNKAAEQYRAILQLYPSTPQAADAQAGLGRAASMVGAYPTAMAAFQAAILLYPGTPASNVSRLGLARLLYLRGDRKAALPLLEAPAAAPDASVAGDARELRLQIAAIEGGWSAAEALEQKRPQAAQAPAVAQARLPAALGEHAAAADRLVALVARAEGAPSAALLLALAGEQALAGRSADAAGTLARLPAGLPPDQAHRGSLIRARLDLAAGALEEAGARLRELKDAPLGPGLLEELRELTLIARLQAGGPAAVAESEAFIRELPGSLPARRAAAAAEKDAARRGDLNGAARLAALLKQQERSPLALARARLQRLGEARSAGRGAESRALVRELFSDELPNPADRELIELLSHPPAKSPDDALQEAEILLIRTAGAERPAPGFTRRLAAELSRRGRLPEALGLLDKVAAASSAGVSTALRLQAALATPLDAAEESRRRWSALSDEELASLPGPERALVVTRLAAAGFERRATSLATQDHGQASELLLSSRGEAVAPEPGDQPALLSADALWRLAMLDEQSGRPAAALELLLRLARDHPGSSFAPPALILALDLARTPSVPAEAAMRAAAAAAAIPSAHPLAPQARLLLAGLRLKAGRLEGIAEELDSLPRRPATQDLLLAQLLRGRLLLQSGQSAEALLHLDRTSGAGQNGIDSAAELLLIRGETLAALGRDEEARSAWGQLISRYPWSRWAEAAREKPND